MRQHDNYTGPVFAFACYATDTTREQTGNSLMISGDQTASTIYLGNADNNRQLRGIHKQILLNANELRLDRSHNVNMHRTAQ